MPPPAFYRLAKVQARKELRERGYTVVESFRATMHIDDAMVDAAVHESNAADGMAAMGDNAILEKIVAFFQSDLGKLLVKILLTLLLGADERETWG